MRVRRGVVWCGVVRALTISVSRSGGGDPSEHAGFPGEEARLAGVLVSARHGARGGERGTTVCGRLAVGDGSFPASQSAGYSAAMLAR